MPFVVIAYVKQQYTSLLRLIAGAIIVMSAIFLVALVSYHILNKVPDLGNNWVWNYLLNFLSQIVVAGGIFLGILALGKRTLKLRAQQAQA